MAYKKRKRYSKSHQKSYAIGAADERKKIRNELSYSNSSGGSGKGCAIGGITFLSAVVLLFSYDFVYYAYKQYKLALMSSNKHNVYLAVIAALLVVIFRQIRNRSKQPSDKPKKKDNEYKINISSFDDEKITTNNGYVILITKQFEHRHIAETVLKRPLNENEVVHHVDGNPQNNNIDNLCVMPEDDHEHFHGWIKWHKEKKNKYPPVEDQKSALVEKYNGILLASPPSTETSTSVETPAIASFGEQSSKKAV